MFQRYTEKARFLARLGDLVQPTRPPRCSKQNLEEPFGRFMTRNARHIVQEVAEQTQVLRIANVLWENAPISGKEKEPLRVTITLAPDELGSNWLIYSTQAMAVDINWLSEGI